MGRADCAVRTCGGASCATSPHQDLAISLPATWRWMALASDEGRKYRRNRNLQVQSSAHSGHMAMTGKERAALRAEAHHLSPLVHVGHQGLTPSLFQSLDDALRTKEL